MTKTVDNRSLLGSELATAPAMSLHITQRGKTDRNHYLTAKQSTTGDKWNHMDNVYSGLMPITGSTAQMGVTITSQPVNKSPRRQQTVESLSG